MSKVLIEVLVIILIAGSYLILYSAVRVSAISEQRIAEIRSRETFDKEKQLKTNQSSISGGMAMTNKEKKIEGRLGYNSENEADVVLAVGLPLTRFSAERKPFIDYLSQNRDVVFGFEQKLYTIHILNVLVYPQCYAAVAGMLPAFGKKALVIDVGSWTVDSMLIVNKKPDNSKCDTQNEGLIKCMRAINRVAIQVKNRKIDEAEIQEYMKTGKTELPKDFKEIMDQQIQDFVDKVYRYQTECGYSLDMVPVYFVGGGAVVMRNFGRYQQSNIHYVLDVKANAKGFETMAKIALRSGR